MANDALSTTDQILKYMLEEIRTAADIILQSTWEILDPWSQKFQKFTADQFPDEVRDVFKQRSKWMSFKIQQIITSTADNIRATMVEYGVDRETATFKSTKEEATVLVGVYLQMYYSSIQPMIDEMWHQMAQDFIHWCQTNTNASKEIPTKYLYDRMKSIFDAPEEGSMQQFQNLHHYQLHLMEEILISTIKKKIAESFDTMLNATVKLIEDAKLSFRSKLAACQGNPWDQKMRNFLQDVIDLCVWQLKYECTTVVNAANKQVLSYISSLRVRTFSYTTRVTAIFQDLNAKVKGMIEKFRQSVQGLVTKQFETRTKHPVQEFKKRLVDVFIVLDPSSHIKEASLKLQSEVQKDYVDDGMQ